MRVTFCCEDTRPDAWLQGLRTALPGAEVDIWSPGAPQADYALVWAPPQRFIDEQPGLKAVFNIGAGVDALLPLRLPPDLPVYRLEDAGMAVQMAEYVSQAVIRFFRGLDGYEADMAAGLWQHRPNPRRADYPVGVMGLGRMGERVARALTVFDFPVNGWSRTPHAIDGVRGFCGPQDFDAFLRATRILVNLLPLTPETDRIIDARSLALLQPGHDLLCRLGLVVLVHGQQLAAGAVQSIGAQQALGVARVLAGHAVHQLQHMQGAQADVGQVAYGGGHHVEGALRIMLGCRSILGCAQRGGERGSQWVSLRKSRQARGRLPSRPGIGASRPRTRRWPICRLPACVWSSAIIGRRAAAAARSTSSCRRATAPWSSSRCAAAARAPSAVPAPASVPPSSGASCLRRATT